MATVPAQKEKCAVLVVDDETAIVRLILSQLGGEFQCECAYSHDEAIAMFEGRRIDIVVTDLGLGDQSGVQLLDWVYRNHPRTARILVSGMARLQDAADAINCARIHRLILKPWRGEDLLAHVREVASTVLLERNNIQLNQELQRLNFDLERRVNERTLELQKMNNILERMALTDTLTGLPNRLSIEKVARQELFRRARLPMPVALGMIDIDYFKDVNTKYLHSGGDIVLASLARVLQHTIRGTDAVGRVGGEEFLVVAPDTDWAGAETLGERLRHAAEKTSVTYEGAVIQVTISIGLAVADANATVDYERMRMIAAQALAEAKTTGRNRVVLLQYAEVAPDYAAV